ncbi:MAG TPA: CrcB family protein [Candidatus Kapabacteria bacterium]|jgi:CrcB protein|nr:CrcB family protein [Ignavibacteria bacterium]HRK58421.1 CrcB family protein [Candidatus Kapabacteria bacterium]
MNILSVILVGIGGFFGSIARYGAGYIIQEIPVHGFPLATFAVNSIGCLLIGVFTELYKQSSLSSQNYLFLATGFCGGFTTFSTFILDCIITQRLSVLMTIIYASTSIIAGYIFLYIGMLCVRFFLQWTGVQS